MTDTMHLLVHKIKAAWWCCNVAAILFLDVEGALPNAVTSCLLHSLCMCRVPGEYILFIDCLLMGRCTRLKFDGYMSDWVDFDNGILQGDPLSMILYLFYNADLIMDITKMEVKVAYVNDANYFAEGATFEDVEVETLPQHPQISFLACSCCLGSTSQKFLCL